MTLKLSFEDDKLILRNEDGEIERTVEDFYVVMIYDTGICEIIRKGHQPEKISAAPDKIALPKNCKNITKITYPNRICVLNFTKLTAFRLYETSKEKMREGIIADLSLLLDQPFSLPKNLDTVVCHFGKFNAICVLTGSPEEIVNIAAVLNEAQNIAYDNERVVNYSEPLVFGKEKQPSLDNDSTEKEATKKRKLN